MRATTLLNKLLALPGVRTTGVEFGESGIEVAVALTRSKLVCPHCEFSTRWRHDTRPVASRWRHLDLGIWRLAVTATLRRLDCPTHGVVTEGVPFARPGTHFSTDFEDLVGYLATQMDKTAIARLVRIDWDSVGRIITRVVGEKLDPARLERLFVIGVDEVSWRKGSQFLTLVSDHQSGRVVWGGQGRNAATLDTFFDALGHAEDATPRGAQLQAVSMDMSASYAKSVRAEGHAPQAVICYDPFHVVQLATKALDQVRRATWQVALSV